jgi:hypothetical protein
MPTFLNDGWIVAIFLFNHIITIFGFPQAIVPNHISHFQNLMIIGFSTWKIIPILSSSQWTSWSHQQSLENHASMHGGDEQKKLEFTTLLISLGLSNFRQNLHWFHTFLVGIWVRSSVANWMQNLIFETSHRTPDQHLCRRGTFLISNKARWDPSWCFSH